MHLWHFHIFSTQANLQASMDKEPGQRGLKASASSGISHIAAVAAAADSSPASKLAMMIQSGTALM